MRSGLIILCAGLLGWANVARAEVRASGEAGFVIRLSEQAAAEPLQVWDALVEPQGWWSADHTYSGDPAMLTLDARAGGCFCEALPARGEGGKARAGSIEHLRVVYANPGRILRLVGALGPLQPEAVNGTLSVVLKPRVTGTEIIWEYVVAGYSRQKLQDLAPIVDRVLGEQVRRLAALFPAAPPPAAELSGTEDGR